jgi:hypothetical protein
MMAAVLSATREAWQVENDDGQRRLQESVSDTLPLDTRASVAARWRVSNRS